jgi:hypothetical protein
MPRRREAASSGRWAAYCGRETVDLGRRIDFAMTPLDWPRAFNKPICSLSSSDKCE